MRFAEKLLTNCFGRELVSRDDSESHRSQSFTSGSSVRTPRPGRVPLSAMAAPGYNTYYATMQGYLPNEEQQISIALEQSSEEYREWLKSGRSRSASSLHPPASQQGATAEFTSASHKWWQEGSLGYNDVISDGFYDVYGDFPEVVEATSVFPGPVDALQKVRTVPGDVREVVLVDHGQDPGLLAVEEQVSDAMAEAKAQDTAERIQVLASVVAERFGGVFDSDSSLEHCWQTSSASEKKRNRSVVILLCRLDVGSSRHRALLFKVLADATKLQCRLVRGQGLCASDSGAVAVVMIGSAEFVVDLVHTPGRLYGLEQYAAITKLKRSRADSWRQSGPATVETSAVSTSSASSTSTTPGLNGGPAHQASAAFGVHAGPPNGAAAAAGAAGDSRRSSTSGCSPRASMGQGPVPALHAPAPQRTVANAPGVGIYQGPGLGVHAPPPPLAGPTGGGVLQGVGTGLGLTLGQGQSHGPGPAIAGSRVRFTITDRPKGTPAAGAGTAAVAPVLAGPADTAGGPSSAGLSTSASTAPAGKQQSAHGPAAASEQGAATGTAQQHQHHQQPPSTSSLNVGSGAGRLTFLPPGKVRSMLDLPSGSQTPDGDSSANSDLIRLDSEPLAPEHAAANAAASEQAFAVGSFGSGSSLGAEPPAAQHRAQQQSLDQNGWVKFGASFSRKPEGAGAAGPGSSRFGPGHDGVSRGSAGAAGAVGSPQVGQHEALASIASSSGPHSGSANIRSGANSILATGASISSAGGSMAGPPQLSSAPPSSAAPQPAPAAGPNPSGLSAASPFAHFLLPPSMSTAHLPGCTSNPLPSMGTAGQTGGEVPVGQRHGGSGGIAPGVAQGQRGETGTISPVPSPSFNPGFAGHQQQAAPPLPQQMPQHHQHQQAAPAHPSTVGAGMLLTGPPSPVPAAGGPGMGFGTGPMAGFGQVALPGLTGNPSGPESAGNGNSAEQAARTGSWSFSGGIPPAVGSAPSAGSAFLSREQLPQAGSALGGNGLPTGGGFGSAFGPGPAGNGNPGAGAFGSGMYYTPQGKKSVSGDGSKAPSPALSTPFAVTPSSAQSTTPPGSAAGATGQFADLSPFPMTALAAAAAGACKPNGDAGDARRESQSGSGHVLGGAGAAGGSQAQGGSKAQSQAFFADLSPFNTGSGSSAGGGGAGASMVASGGGASDRGGGTPLAAHTRSHGHPVHSQSAQSLAHQPPMGPHHRRTSTGTTFGAPSQQPIIELPDSDTSRETTPRVSYSSMPDPSTAAHPGGVQYTMAEAAAEALTAELARTQLGPPAGRGGQPMGSGMGGAMRLQPHMQQPPNHMGFPHAFGPHMMHPQQQQQAAMAYFNAMQGGQLAYYQQALLAANNANMLQHQQPFLHGGMHGGVPGMGWRPGFDPAGGGVPWMPAWTMQQQQQQQQAMMQQQQAMIQQQHHGNFMPQFMHPHRPPNVGLLPAPGPQQQQLQLAGSSLVAAGPTGGGGFGAQMGPSMAAQQQQQQQQLIGQRVSVSRTTTTVVETKVVETAAASLPQPSASTSGNSMPSAFGNPAAAKAAAGGGSLPSAFGAPSAAAAAAGGSLPSAFGTPSAASQAVGSSMPSAFGVPAAAAAAAGGGLPSAFGNAAAALAAHDPAHAGPSSGSSTLQATRPQPVDISHENTLPSQARLAMVAAAAAGGGHPSDGGATSPLALQPTLSASMPLPPSYKDLEIEPSELTFGARIGMGSYGEVFRGTWRGTDVAIKRFLEQNLSAGTIREFRDEVMIMSKLRHPNIVLFMGAVTRSNQLAIVTQFVQRGSLFRLLHRTKVELDPRRRLGMALDIAKGMEYLHNCKPVLVHRDLKSPNLLVDRDWTVKVCDFGLSQVKMNTFLTAKSQGGSPAWMAPEILRNERCDEKSDVFSFGVILYEMVTGKEPWEELNPMQVVGTVGFHGHRMPLPTDLDPAVSALITSCWAEQPTARPSFGQVLATLQSWAELRPTARVMEQQAALARAKAAKAAAGQ